MKRLAVFLVLTAALCVFIWEPYLKAIFWAVFEFATRAM